MATELEQLSAYCRDKVAAADTLCIPEAEAALWAQIATEIAAYLTEGEPDPDPGPALPGMEA